MTDKRKAISKRMRFEVLKRDLFTCQYCGKQPPDTVLHLDHIKPVSKGGKNTVLNLVTSCIDCNLGKSNVELSDDSAIKKQQKQLSEMAEKKAQIEMMIDWRESLIDSDELLVDSALKIINAYLDEENKSVSISGVSSIRKAIKKNGYPAVVDAIEKVYRNNDEISGKWDSAIKYAGVKKGNSIHYIKGILKNRIGYFNEKRFYAETSGIELDDENYSNLVSCAKKCESISEFINMIEVQNG